MISCGDYDLKHREISPQEAKGGRAGEEIAAGVEGRLNCIQVGYSAIFLPDYVEYYKKKQGHHSVPK